MADLTGMLQAAAGSAAGGGGAYIEDVFSTYLYTGNGSTQTITNGIDLDGEGGLVWIKGRAPNPVNHSLVDSERGVDEFLSITTDQEYSFSGDVGLSPMAFNSNGFTTSEYSTQNSNNATYASWTFRKAPKFFDCVTYTGTGSARTVSHNLGSVPGCIIVKRTDTTGAWQVYHRANTANPETDYLVLNSDAATVDSNTRWNDTAPTDSVFTVGTEATVNASGGTYVAYLFAHDAGGFGDDSSENVITCGGYTGNGSATGPVINLGYEPQWILLKRATGGVSNWYLHDTMRGLPVGGTDAWLEPDRAVVEANVIDWISPTAVGFNIVNTQTGINASGSLYIYIAIRRGPMKTPTSGTEVFSLATRTGNATQTALTGVGFPPDLFIANERVADSGWRPWFDRLRGSPRFITPSVNFTAEVSNDTDVFKTFDQDGVTIGTDVANNGTNKNTRTYVNYFLRRSPKCFDIVCFTGTGSAQALSHNLQAIPELMFVRCRSASNDWAVYAGDNTDYLLFNSNAATADDNTYWNDTAPTSSAFTVGTNADVNTSSETYVAYLFASLAGVCKVGTYTGTGTTQAINCGFSSGARFILIKRTDSTGDWYMWDSARGIVSGDDPYIIISSFYSSEVTNTDYIDPSSAGFEITSTAPDAINASGGSFIYLAIA